MRGWALHSAGASLTVSSTWTPTAAMPSAFYWPLLVPCAPAGLRRQLTSSLGPNSFALEAIIEKYISLQIYIKFKMRYSIFKIKQLLAALAIASLLGCTKQRPENPPTPTSVAVTTSVAAITQGEEPTSSQQADDCKNSTQEIEKQYSALIKKRKHSEAATIVRLCAETLNNPKLLDLLKEAEIASFMTDINDKKRSPRDRARSIQILSHAYPEAASGLERQAKKLNAEAELKDEDDLRRKKRSEGVYVGMSKADVLSSSWGNPKHVNTTTTSFGSREQWVYGGRNYIYFENGYVTSIQN
jgi:hypothetical protein